MNINGQSAAWLTLTEQPTTEHRHQAVTQLCCIRYMPFHGRKPAGCDEATGMYELFGNIQLCWEISQRHRYSSIPLKRGNFTYMDNHPNHKKLNISSHFWHYFFVLLNFPLLMIYKLNWSKN